ncbi:hypothetical protein ABZP36_024665 [Zizania latifolia]
MNIASAGFQSIDCGGSGNYTDELGLEWTADDTYVGAGAGKAASTSTSSQSQSQAQRRPYSTVRYFPADGRKYCYTLGVQPRTRYLLRASFLYGNFDGSRVFPEFGLYVGASRWSTIVIYDESRVVTREMVALAQSPTLAVCLANATTGQPFISALELRPLNGSLYHTSFEATFFLGLAARVNFGAPTPDPVRYPNDPYDRVWESDMARRANFLVDAAPGTVRVATDRPVFVGSGERPPQKVMQTAVVGTLGALTYRLDLNGFPGSGWACSYLAEIEEDAPPAARRFKLYIPGLPEVSKPTVDIGENAPGKYRVYEPGYDNISLPFVLPFAFRKTDDSARGPILNAMEIYRYIPIVPPSPDAVAMATLAARYQPAAWAQEGGDPCVPSPWSWLRCSSAESTQPSSRVIAINLSGKNLTGGIPPELAALSCLQEIRLDNNMFTGPIPDLSASPGLSVIHLENNQLTGGVPSYLSNLPKLSELYVQNNRLSGVIPRTLLSKSIVFKYLGNTHLRTGKQEQRNVIILVSALLGISLLLAAALCCCYVLTRRTAVSKRKGAAQRQAADADHEEEKGAVGHSQKKGLPQADEPTGKKRVKVKHEMMNSEMTIAGPLELRELEEATNKFARRIGSGGFGVVYYGRLADGREIAVKVASNDSVQGRKQLANESGGGIGIGPWAKSFYESGDIEAIVDPSLSVRGSYQDVHSVWKVAETAVRCIDADPRRRPSMPEVVKDIQEAIALERPSLPSERASCFSPATGASTVRSHDLIMDNLMLMHDSASFSDSLNRTANY